MQGLGVKRRTVEVEASAQFCCQVLCIGGAATVAAEMYLATGTEAGFNQLCSIRYGLHQGVVTQYCLFDGDALFYRFLYSVHNHYYCMVQVFSPSLVKS